MYKKILMIASFLLVSASFLGVMSMQRVSADSDVRICHADNSTHDPYNSITVDHDAVNGMGGGDHYKDDKGSIAFSEVEANRLKNLHIKWGDIIPPVSGHHAGLNWTAMGQAMWNNRCNFVTTVVPSEVAFVDQTCDSEVLGTYTIPTTLGVKYLVGEVETVAGTYSAENDTTVTITAVAKTGYVIGDTAIFQWTHEFNAPTVEECSETVVPSAVTFVAPTCDALGSYTIPALAGVEYSVGDIVKTAGTYSVANRTSVTVIATELEGYVLDGTSEWSYTSTAPSAASCVLGITTVVPIKVTFTAPTCSVLGTYTIPSITGVVYSVGGVVKTSGTYAVANGATVVVTAAAAEGYSIEDTITSKWTYTFTALSCGSVLGTSTTVTTLPLTSGDTTAANVTIFSLVAGAITIIGFAARSIFARQF